MSKRNIVGLFLSVVILFFGANVAFAQCGPDGTQPCPTVTPKKTTPKKTTPKTNTKPTVSTPTTTAKKPQTTISKPQAKFVPRAPEIEMVKIPSGSFMMGSYTEGNYPVRFVNIDYSFYIGKYEITQAQWKSVMGNNPSYFKDCGGNCPVESIYFKYIKEFIQKLNDLQDEFEYRLPTEAEWEYSCRAGTATDTYGDLRLIAWYAKNSDQTTHPIGQKQPNTWGLFDMMGNVAEICAEDENSKGLPPVRGCSWHCSSWTSYSSYGSTGGGNDDGFRLAATPK